MKEIHSIIKEVCEELGIKMSLLSKDWIVMLEKGDKTRFIAGYKFDGNSHALGEVMDDKYAMYEVLSKKGIPVIEHTIAFRPSNHNEYAKTANRYENILEYFQNHKEDIVVKANNSTCGNEVFHITTKEDLRKILDQLFVENFSISLCPFYSIQTEYRLIYLGNECVLLYGKKRPVVIGNGKNTIRELLRQFNPTFFQNKLEEEFYNRILTVGEKYEYTWQFNLSKGSIPFEEKNTALKERLLHLGNIISREIGLKFCSVDIILTDQDELLVMELNSGVMMSNYMKIMPNGREIAHTIYKRAIEEMFQEEA